MSTSIISFPRDLDDELAELIAEKARVCGGGAYDIWEMICARHGTEIKKPSAWQRKWAADGIKPYKQKNENGRWAWAPQFRWLPITDSKVFGDDVPLYAMSTGASEP